MPRAVSGSAAGNIFTGLSITRRRSACIRASSPALNHQQNSNHPFRHRRAASSHVASVDPGLYSPPSSESDEPKSRGQGWRLTIRRVPKSPPGSRLSSFADSIPSPPESGSENYKPIENDENALGSAIQRRRRPLQLALPDGPADELGASVDGLGRVLHNVEYKDVPPFPLQPLPSIVAIHFPASVTQTKQNIKRRWASTGTPHQAVQSIPDRFISSRSTSQDATENFRVNKRTSELSSYERLLRHHSASPDPFESSTRARVARRQISSNQARNTGLAASRTGSGTNLLNPLGNPATAQARHISTGSVWNVGGSSATTPSGPITGISDGRGRFIGSGTNAPMYTSRFFESDTPEVDRGRLERRLAAALDIDQVSRVLNHSQSRERDKSQVFSRGGSNLKTSYSQPHTMWENGQWVRQRSTSRKYNSSSQYLSPFHGRARRELALKLVESVALSYVSVQFLLLDGATRLPMDHHWLIICISLGVICWI